MNTCLSPVRKLFVLFCMSIAPSAMAVAPEVQDAMIAIQESKLRILESNLMTLKANLANAERQISELRGSLDYADGNLSFGKDVRQMINLYDTRYGIGVQSGTQYFRTGGGFAFFQNGIHSDSPQDPGEGGKKLLSIGSDGTVKAGGDIYADGKKVFTSCKLTKNPITSVLHRSLCSVGSSSFISDDQCVVLKCD